MPRTKVVHPPKSQRRRRVVSRKCITPEPPFPCALLEMPKIMPQKPAASWSSSAGWGLAILSFINLFNYLDRFLVPALFESLKRSELRLSDTELDC